MANGILLSILIPTITGRETQFARLYTHLNDQLYKYGIWNEVEIVSECDDRIMSIGIKRQVLINRSYGEYIVFIDDDDWVPDNYCFALWNVLRNNPETDCIGFLQRCVMDGVVKTASISHRWPAWQENKGGYDYVRTPFFPTPMRRSIAVEIGYNDMRFGEDHDFSIRLKASGLIKKEEFIYAEMYFYQFTTVAGKYTGKKL